MLVYSMLGAPPSIHGSPPLSRSRFRRRFSLRLACVAWLKSIRIYWHAPWCLAHWNPVLVKTGEGARGRGRGAHIP